MTGTLLFDSNVVGTRIPMAIGQEHRLLVGREVISPCQVDWITGFFSSNSPCQPLARSDGSHEAGHESVPSRCKCVHILNVPWSDSDRRRSESSSLWPARISVIETTHRSGLRISGCSGL